MEYSMEVPQKLNIELSYNLAIPVLGEYPHKSIIQIHEPLIHSGTVYNIQGMETT